MSVTAYANIIAAARTGRASFSEAEVQAALMPLIWPNGRDRDPSMGPGEWLDRDEAFKHLADLPFTIANVISGDRVEAAINPSYAMRAEAFVMYVHGINRYAFDVVHEEEAAGKEGNRTNPERLRGGPKFAYAILKDAGAQPALTNDPSGDEIGLGGTRVIIPIGQDQTEVKKQQKE